MDIDRAVKKAPSGESRVDTLHFMGITQDICLQDPLFDLVIGNIVGARKPKHSVLGEKTCAAAVGRV